MPGPGGARRRLRLRAPTSPPLDGHPGVLVLNTGFQKQAWYFSGDTRRDLISGFFSGIFVRCLLFEGNVQIPALPTWVIHSYFRVFLG